MKYLFIMISIMISVYAMVSSVSEPIEIKQTTQITIVDE